MKIFKQIIIALFIIFFVYLILNAPNLFHKMNFTINKQKLIKQKQKIIDANIYQNNTLIIPNLNIQAPIIFPKDQNEQIILDSLQKGIVHFPYTAKPGQKNNSVLIGHSGNFFWNRGDFNTIFTNLNQIKKDDPIYVVYKNKLYKYLTLEKTYLNANDLFILNQDNQSFITLLTCWPLGTDYKRLAVRGKLTKK